MLWLIDVRLWVSNFNFVNIIWNIYFSCIDLEMYVDIWLVKYIGVKFRE